MMKMKQLIVSAFLLFMSGITFAFGGTRAPELVVFGDSLSDMGNVYGLTSALRVEPAIPPSDEPYRTFWQGRFSNGPIWAEYLADTMGIDLKTSIAARARKKPKGINFAWGGATSESSSLIPAGFPVPGFLGQVALYKLRFNWINGTSPDTLFAIWVGADDFLLNSGPDPVDPDVVVANIVQGIHELHGLGARRIMVANLPELCVLPVGQLPLGCPQPGDLTSLTPAQLFNDALHTELEELALEWPQTEIYLVDIYSAAQEVFLPYIVNGLEISGPATGCLFGLTNATDPGEVCPDLNPDGSYIATPLWDEQHPTTELHFVIATEPVADALGNPL